MVFRASVPPEQDFLLEQRLVRRKRHRQGALRHVGKGHLFGVSLWRAAVMARLDTEFRIDEHADVIACESQTRKVTVSIADMRDDINEALDVAEKSGMSIDHRVTTISFD